MGDGYEYEVFLSYSHAGSVQDWITTYFEPRLRKALIDEHGRGRIYLDAHQGAGTIWEQKLTRALGRSRLLVPVLSAPYFGSQYCCGEWRTFRARDRVLGRNSHQDPRSLVVPIHHSDGEHFDPDARNVVIDRSFENYMYSHSGFEASPEFTPFMNALQTFAKLLAKRLADSPPWCPDWPIEWPQDPPEDPPPSGLTRL